LIRVEPEIVQCSPANGIGVLVLSERLGIPGYGIGSLINSPRRAAIPLVILRAVICPAGLLRGRMKVDVADIHSRCKRHAERLNTTIEIFVIKSIFVMPHSRSRIGHLVTHKPDSIIPRVWLKLVYSGPRTCPSHDGRLHPYGRVYG
jgi:hypothetical protein